MAEQHTVSLLDFETAEYSRPHTDLGRQMPHTDFRTEHTAAVDNRPKLVHWYKRVFAAANTLELEETVDTVALVQDHSTCSG